MVVRTTKIHPDRLEEFLAELREVGKIIKENGGTVRDRGDNVFFDEIKMGLVNTGEVYFLKIEGDDKETEDIGELYNKFSKYEKEK